VSSALAATCPVCADLLAGPMRTCPRCRTPHHPECWDYLPGCAIFGCADAPEVGPPAIVEWPWARRLVLVRARLRSAAATTLYAGSIAFAVAVALNDTAWKPYAVELSVLAGVVLVLLVPALLLAELAYWFSPARAEVARAEADGDRRLQAALERRVGRVANLSPWVTSLLLGVMICLPFPLRTWLGLQTGKSMLGALVGFLVVTPLVGAVFLPAVWLASQLVGSQKVLLNRLEASQRGPEKPALPPGDGAG